MANREACELYIEQEIKDGLEQGKKPYSIGKELSAWIEKLFETSIKPTTIEKRAERIRETLPTSVGNNSQPPEITTNSQRDIPEIIKDRLPQGGGAREGAGRPVSDESIELFLVRAKKLARLAYKARSAPSFEMRKKELISAANLVAIVITETREDLKWV